MLVVTDNFLQAIREPDREIFIRVDLGGTIIDSEIIVELETEQSMGTDILPTIGGATASKLILKVLNSDLLPETLTGIRIRPFIGLKTGIDLISYGSLTTFKYNQLNNKTYDDIGSDDVVTWLALGDYYPESGDIVKTKSTITIECFNKMTQMDRVQYVSNLEYPTTIYNVLNEIQNVARIEFETFGLDSFNVPSAPVGTIRQALSQLAVLAGANIVVDKDGLFRFRFIEDIPVETFTFDANNYVSYELTADNLSKISQIINEIEEEKFVTGNNTGLAIKFNHPTITTQEQLDGIFAKAYPLQFTSYNMKCQGFPHLEIGDRVLFTDVDGVSREIIIAQHKLRYNGGLTSEFSCESVKDDNKDVDMTGGSNTQYKIETSVGKAERNFAKTMEGAIRNATELITGTQGGNLYTQMVDGKPVALYILDTNDIDTAQNVWAWTLGGLGFSSTGIDGDFSLAMTSDGQIVADFIKTGQLDANLIKAGIIQSASGGAYINLNDGSFGFTSGNTKFSSDDGLTVGDKTIDEALGDKADSDILDDLHQYLTYNMNDGLTMKTGDVSDGTLNEVQILGTGINFKNNGVLVAYIQQEKLYIENAHINDTFVINNHQFKRYNDEITIVTWIGG